MFIVSLKDGTGTIDATDFTSKEGDGQERAAKPRPFAIGDYIHVYGNIKPIKGMRNLSSFHAKKVTNMNEITLHMLDAMYYYDFNTIKDASNIGTGVANMNVQGDQNPGGWLPSHGAHGGGQSYGGISPLQSTLLQVVKQFGTSSEGAFLPDIIQQLSHMATDGEIRYVSSVILSH